MVPGAGEIWAAAPAGRRRASRPATGRPEGPMPSREVAVGCVGAAASARVDQCKNPLNVAPHKDGCGCAERCLPPQTIVNFGQKLLKGSPGTSPDNPTSVWMLLYVDISVETSHVMWS